VAAAEGVLKVRIEVTRMACSITRPCSGRLEVSVAGADVFDSAALEHLDAPEVVAELRGVSMKWPTSTSWLPTTVTTRDERAQASSTWALHVSGRRHVSASPSSRSRFRSAEHAASCDDREGCPWRDGIVGPLR
jgi:hypothetical protein